MPAVLAMLACAAHASGAPSAGLSFTHLDWEIACDNTRTCRAAGYQVDNADDSDIALPVSVQLTRKAGPREPVQGELQVANPDEDQSDENWLRKLSLAMTVNGKPAGKVVANAKQGTLDLSAQQTALLVSALAGKSRIEWSDGKHTWKLSDKGASAVLLKMDEFQARLGTTGALVRKGARDESGVLPPLPAPVIQAAAVPADDGVQLSTSALQALRVAVAASMKECTESESGRPQEDITVRRLTANTLLASATCWTGAYNQGSAYWVVNARAPFSPRLVTTDGSDYADGKISASHKGRGIGDCWSFQEWIWDGQRFVHTSEGTTGQCKSVPGGFWSLPVLVTTVRGPKAGAGR